MNKNVNKVIFHPLCLDFHHFKSSPLVGTSSLEEIRMLDGYREYIVYNGNKIFQNSKNNPLILSLRKLINSGVGQDFEEMAFETFNFLKIIYK